jgi:hypothetical protein
MPVKTGVGHVVIWTVGVALAIGGCASDREDVGRSAERAAGASKSDGARSAAANQALVKWADHMCEATELFETMKKESAGAVEEITDPPEDALIAPEFTAMSYLPSTSSSLNEVAQRLADVQPSGITAADRLHDSLAKEVQRVQPKVTGLTDSSEFTSPAEDSVDRAEHVGKLIESLKTPMPDLAAVVAEEPKLSAAYRRAPKCAPPEPLPKAADGTDIGACKDGSCEVLVTEQVDVVVGAWKLRVSPMETKVMVRNGGPKGGVGETGLGAGGTGSFGEANGDKVTVRAVAVDGDGAVLKFSTT